MAGFLLDTNILSDLVRNPQGRIATAIVEAGEAEVATSVIVAAELRFGAVRRGSKRLSAQVEAILGAIPVLALEAPADRVYGRLRAELEKTGRLIGANDMLIAAHALALDRILVTDNVREFARVNDLRTLNWLR